MTASIALADSLAERLGAIPGVAAVVLGGSHARGDADSNSDIDLGILYHASLRPDLGTLRALARDVDDRHLPDIATPYDAWGPWINGGAWLIVGGKRVDWLYRDVDKVRDVIAECRAGRPVLHNQPGHPHGFHSHIYLGEVHSCVPLLDPRGTVADLKELVARYPAALHTALVDRFLWEARFALETASGAAARGDVYYVSGCLFRSVASLVQVLYAINERYFTNEKGSVRTASHFPLCPTDFGNVVPSVLSAIGASPAALSESLVRLETLVEATEELYTVYR